MEDEGADRGVIRDEWNGCALHPLVCRDDGFTGCDVTVNWVLESVCNVHCSFPAVLKEK